MTVILEQFIHTLSESGLMTAEEVQQVIQLLPDDQRPQSGEDLAKLLYSQGKLTKFQAQAIYQGKTKGLVLGNYVVLDKIGQGGMGHVYKAEHCRMKRQVALKVLPSALTKEQEAVQRFQREVQAAARLSHPNIVTAHDADEADGVHFLVMEYVQGDDLAKRVQKRGPLSVGDAVDCVLQAAKGLRCAHEAGIVHRDIKPSNLLIDQSGNVKVLDMGLARLEETIGQDSTTAAAALTQTGQVMGTIDYMPPEQVDSTHRVDHRADIYSLGCTLFCLLMGRPVYSGDSVTARALAHREEPIPSLRQLRQDVPEKLDAVFQKMAAKRPEDRYASMTEVIAELEACQKALQEPVQDTLSTGGGPTGGGETERDGADALAFVMEKPAGGGSSADDWLQEELPKAPTLLRTKPQPQTKAVNVPVIIASAATLAFLLLLAGVIFMIRTPNGAVVVQVDDPSETALAEELSKPRWLGYGVRSPADVKEVADYTNIIWVYTDNANGNRDDVIDTARVAGLKVVLVFECDAGAERLKQETLLAASKNSDVVAAVCWELPYSKGHQPSDLAQFGKALDESAPGVQLWCNSAFRGKAASLSIPTEVDALMLEMGYVTTPETVKARADRVAPERTTRAEGRPVHLIWWNGNPKKPRGLVPECQPGMIRMLGQVAETYELSGLFLVSYGKGYKDAIGIGTSSGLVSETKEIANRWGIGSPPIEE